MNEVVIYTDGGARGNPGPAGAGAVVYDNEVEVGVVSDYLGVQTNNVAEYEALIRALECAKKTVKNIHERVVVVRMDSELIVKQMKGEYRVKDPTLKLKHAVVQELIQKDFPHISFVHVRREKNTRADELANYAMDNPE